MGLSVILFEKNTEVAKSLARRLRVQFHSVYIFQADHELHSGVAKRRPDAVILDIEFANLSDVATLHRDFPTLPIVCIHRIPDEAMWMAALEAGASELCPSDDAENLTTSVLRSMSAARVVAA